MSLFDSDWNMDGKVDDIDTATDLYFLNEFEKEQSGEDDESYGEDYDSDDDYYSGSSRHVYSKPGPKPQQKSAAENKKTNSSLVESWVFMQNLWLRFNPTVVLIIFIFFLVLAVAAMVFSMWLTVCSIENLALNCLIELLLTVAFICLHYKKIYSFHFAAMFFMIMFSITPIVYFVGFLRYGLI